MIEGQLTTTANALVANHKGLLAIDESVGTCNKRFAKLGIPQTLEMRRKYREMIITTPGLNESISGAILFDETIRQAKPDGTSFIKVLIDAGIIPGIKVDLGVKPLAGFLGEKVTEGLDDLGDRLAEYYDMGARFAKWRAVIEIGKNMPSQACIEANAHALARYAALSQQAGMVPIVEPEVLMKGDHTLEKCLDVTNQALHMVFDQLYKQQVSLSGMLLKPNMILPGLDSSDPGTIHLIAQATLSCLLSQVPPVVPGITFLSGGQSPEMASERLNGINVLYGSDLPWALSFSFGRALQQPALALWNGNDKNIEAAQRVLYHRAKCNREACKGEYSSKFERKS